ncbi:MAG: 7-cyano-7-deazaguanine synthase QueC [Deltaproteobacteria bacterium]|nr:7-cyano-7-deazaguanine synthase QueC [Deltaproteobacteria bacterium]
MELKTENKPIAIVLVSGGMDSLVAAAIASLEHETAFLHLNYGQRTEKRELKAFNDIADFYKVEKRLVVDVKYLREIGGSALTDERIEVPAHTPHPIPHIPITYVPFRNAHLLSIAVSWAEVIGAKKIYIGAVEEDSSGYPDCREVFYKAFEKAIDAGTKPETRIEIITPLIHMKKLAIVKKGMELNAPFHLTWSCYLPPYPLFLGTDLKSVPTGGHGEVACGECDSCRLRLKGFREAGVDDPIPYK